MHNGGTPAAEMFVGEIERGHARMAFKNLVNRLA